MESSKPIRLALLLVFISAMSTAGIVLSPSTALAAPKLFFPWDYNENPWVLTRGPHDWGNSHTQSGLDFDKNKTARRVLSMFDGEVTFVGLGERFYCKETKRYTQNSIVKVRATDGSGWELWYLHLSRFSVLKGTPISIGDLLGYSGNVGCSTGVHLHVELLIKGVHSSWWGKSINGWKNPSGTWFTWLVNANGSVSILLDQVMFAQVNS